MAKVIFRSVSYNHGDDGYFSFQSIDQKASHVQNIDVVVGKSSIAAAKGDAHIYGSCNGLLLIRVGIDLFLWNPSVCSIQGQLSHGSLIDYDDDYVDPGLCFDFNNDEYKAVLALTDDSYHIRMVVGSFKTKSWRNVNLPYNISGFISSGPTLNNKIHWLLCDYDGSNDVLPLNILYVDPEKEELLDLPMPNAEEGKGSETDDLSVLDGCLCMNRKEPSIGATEVLAMKEYGVKESWTVLFKLKHDVGRNPIDWAVPLFFMGEVEPQVLMHLRMKDEKEVIARYYINNDSWKEIAIVNAEYPYDIPVVYEETSVGPTMRSKNKTAATGTHAKTVWKVKDNCNNSSESEEGEEDCSQRMLEVVNEWQVPKKKNGKKSAVAESPLVDPLRMRNKFNILAGIQGIDL